VPVAIHELGNQMYLIHDPVRDGWLTWDYGGNRYVMAFTESEKAEEYNAIVMQHQPGDIMIIRNRHAMEFARKMVLHGVRFMIIDFPVINDQDFWDNPVFEIGAVPTEAGRDYAIVDLGKIVEKAG